MILLTTMAGAVVTTSSVAWFLVHRARKKLKTDIQTLRSRCETPIEEMLFDELIKRKIIPEPQYSFNRYRLDFAISPKMLKINVECDGKDYHDIEWTQIEKDRQRNAYLTSKGWAVLRFSGRSIHRDISECGKIIEETIQTRKRQLGKKIG
jgi:very-short-patch-repair endonuclease